MIWAEVKEIWSQGPGEYLLEPWNFLDFGMLAIFLASFSCRFSILRHANLAQTFVRARYTTLNNIQLPPEIEYFTKGEHVHTLAQITTDKHKLSEPGLSFFYWTVKKNWVKQINF